MSNDYRRCGSCSNFINSMKIPTTGITRGVCKKTYFDVYSFSDCTCVPDENVTPKEFAFNGQCKDCPHLMSSRASADPLSHFVYKCILADAYVDPTDFCSLRDEQPATEPKNGTPIVDIHKIIDDAMEKKDRYVTIFISKEGTTINVHPYEDKESKWIYHDPNESNYHFECSECGSISEFATPYCPVCGEKLKIQIERK